MYSIIGNIPKSLLFFFFLQARHALDTQQKVKKDRRVYYLAFDTRSGVEFRGTTALAQPAQGFVTDPITITK